MRNIEGRLSKLEASAPAGNGDMIDVIVLTFIDKNGPCDNLKPKVLFPSYTSLAYRTAFMREHPDYDYSNQTHNKVKAQ